uniref:Uncharacterized protein n=1 Tax=Hyaloperonospora arabidopsidis (strain Emoy2) TaxID=559515 RepID=M4BK17_HYAAE
MPILGADTFDTFGFLFRRSTLNRNAPPILTTIFNLNKSELDRPDGSCHKSMC